MKFAQRYKSTVALLGILTVATIAALMTTAIVGVMAVSRQSQAEDIDRRNSVQMIEDVYMLEVNLERQAVGLRGFLIAGDDSFLDPWREGLTESNRLIGLLDAARHDQNETELLKVLRIQHEHYFAFGQRLIALRKLGRNEQVRRIFEENSPELQGPMMREMKRVTEALVTARHNDVERLHLKVAALEKGIKNVMVLGAAVAIALAALLSLMIARWVGVPLRDLEQAAHGLASGAYHVRAPKRRNDEFGAVAEAFNGMAIAVEQALGSLQTANAELTRLDRFRDDFLSVVTHELKTPLTAIMGYGRMLERGTNGPLADEQRGSVAIILRNAKRLHQLVCDLLDVTVIRQGQLELVRTPTPYAALVTELMGQVLPLAEEKGVSLNVQVEVYGIPILDAARILQVLNNLVSNAIKFTSPGGRITLTAISDGNSVVTEVTDTGIGIESDDLLRIFEPFARGRDGAGDRALGTGLGLAICAALVRAHGGTITCTSEVGLGSTFRVELPFKPSPAALTPASGPA